MRKQRRWQDLSMKEKMSITVLSIVQFALLVAALADIVMRPASKIKGKKWVWAAISFINFIGPLAYFLLGRKK
jgi:hypothetical protein